MSENVIAVVPWVSEEQRALFCEAWGVMPDVPWVVFQPDPTRRGSGVTKNEGIDEAVRRGADVVVVLDDDCFPEPSATPSRTIRELMELHVAALKPQPVRLFEPVTEPWSRGTPYDEANHCAGLPVAASMGFWTNVGDHCAVRQLVHGPTPMRFLPRAIYGRWFPLCGMNLAFRPAEWDPWWRFIEVHRFDDIWQGWLWQKEAYRRGHCFNLAGPLVRHSRQSNVWTNLAQEAPHLAANETLWRRIAEHPSNDYDTLRALLPPPHDVRPGR